MEPTIAGIAAALGAEAAGDTSLRIARLAEPAEAGAHDLALAMAPKYADALGRGRARAAVLWPGADWRALGLAAAIFAPRPRLALAGLTRALDPGPDIAPGIHPSTIIDPTARIGADAAIGPVAVIGPKAEIGAGARIGPHVSIGQGARIGAGCLLGAGARIGAGVTIGANFIAGPGAVVGADGLSFVTEETSRVEAVRRAMAEAEGAGPQAWVRIHSLGAVTIGNDVEIGANTAIDRGTVRDTRIGRGTKIDNLVHIAHNVVVGEDCLFAAGVGIAGSTVIGDRVVFGGQVGVVDNISVGSDVVAGGGSKILSNVPAGRAVLGYPAVRMERQVEIYRHLRRLPRLAAEFAGLKKAVSIPGGND